MAFFPSPSRMPAAVHFRIASAYHSLPVRSAYLFSAFSVKPNMRVKIAASSPRDRERYGLKVPSLLPSTMPCCTHRSIELAAQLFAASSITGFALAAAAETDSMDSAIVEDRIAASDFFIRICILLIGRIAVSPRLCGR